MLICIYYYDDVKKVLNILIETVILFPAISIIKNFKKNRIHRNINLF